MKQNFNFLDAHFRKLLSLALQEDRGSGDVTTQALFGKKSPRVRAKIFSKQPLVVAGLEVARIVFRKVDPSLKVEILQKEGKFLEEEESLMILRGSAASILTAERLALNFLQHLSGIATLTHLFVQKVQGTKAKILDTRKTVPGLRKLAKHAVLMGGGANHRFGLYDAYLIKDNHLAFYGSIAQAIAQVRKHNRRKLKVEVEVENLEQFEQALQAGADWVLLDNMPLEDLRLAVIWNKKETRLKACVLEASGNVDLNNVRAVAETGVDYISVGSLTHSASAVDLSLEIDPA